MPGRLDMNTYLADLADTGLFGSVEEMRATEAALDHLVLSPDQTRREMWLAFADGLRPQGVEDVPARAQKRVGRPPRDRSADLAKALGILERRPELGPRGAANAVFGNPSSGSPEYRKASDLVKELKGRAGWHPAVQAALTLPERRGRPRK